MSIVRDADDLPGGVLVNADRIAGEDVVDHDEYEEMVDDADVVYPAAHTAEAMTLGDVHPGYDPDDE